MVDVMHYKVIKKANNAEKRVNIYLFLSDGDRWFAAAAAPEDVEFDVGDTLKHHSGDQWMLESGTTIKIGTELKCTTEDEALVKFQELSR